MTIEATLERIASALEALAGVGGDAAETLGTAAVEKRGRGRPRKTPEPTVVTEMTGPALSAAIAEDEFQPAKGPDVDNFGEPEAEAPTAPAKVYTADDVRAALVGLQKRATPEKARGILRDVGGADTLKALKPEKYQAVVEAAEKAA